jgi:hypothetical protein
MVKVMELFQVVLIHGLLLLMVKVMEMFQVVLIHGLLLLMVKVMEVFQDSQRKFPCLMSSGLPGDPNRVLIQIISRMF